MDDAVNLVPSGSKERVTWGSGGSDNVEAVRGGLDCDPSEVIVVVSGAVEMACGRERVDRWLECGTPEVVVVVLNAVPCDQCCAKRAWSGHWHAAGQRFE
ncbi:hypothetical protein VTK73DRAFT_2713 [Phialemonium thermophilum]|uniref:Uncharacterized protein n=1 Tax=Phialemonium thermophilum TaxID=223376 RepID=A0ABR3VQQ3_9PEZI